MKTNSSKNFIVLFGVLIFVAFLRIVLREHERIDNIIAGINIVSLWFVTYLILENAEMRYFDRLKKDINFGEHTKIQKKKYFKKIIKWLRIIIFILGIFYMIIFANPVVNDIIGSSSLFLSIEEDYICNYIQNTLYKRK